MLKFDFLSLLSSLLKNKVLKRFCWFFFKGPGAKKAIRESPGYFNQILTFESRKWSPVATFESWNNKSALIFFDFRLFHVQKQGETMGKKPKKNHWLFLAFFIIDWNMTIWVKTCFWRWKSRKLKKLRALILFQN